MGVLGSSNFSSYIWFGDGITLMAYREGYSPMLVKHLYPFDRK